MAYAIRYQMDVVWIGDGLGPMGALTTSLNTGGGGGAQVKSFFQTTLVPVPGGDSPTAANFNTAITGTMTTDLEAQVLANLGQLQGFATGGG